MEATMAKAKLALYWAASCGGCDVAVLDTNDKILDIAALADIVLWPVAVDYKYHHIEEMAKNSVDLCLFNGAIRNSEQERLAKLLRDVSKVMIAFGTCACHGGIPALGNFANRSQIFERVYQEVPTVDGAKTLPQTRTKVVEGELELPEFWDSVVPLNKVVQVDYYIPGCPPPVDLILTAINAFATNKLPPPGSIIASTKTVCDECERIKEDKKISKIRRVHEAVPDPKTCFLEQGFICLGPATRGGCGDRCMKANMPCRGCFGPPPGVIDQGAKMLSTIASIYQGSEPEDVQRLVNEIVDPAGTFYRFGMGDSILKKKRIRAKQEVK
jgi:F420-non-reducing hydrogenase small subunit